MFVQAILWCFLAAVARAYSSFDLLCTRPADTFNFVSSPDARGTLEVLWGSLFTLIACTWTIHHPNLPEQRDSRDPGFKGALKWGAKDFVESAKLAFVTILAPELIISVALDQLRLAIKVEEALKEEAKYDEVPWTLTHGHYAAMGGFVIREKVSTEKSRGGLPYHLTADDVIFLRKKGLLKKLPKITQDEICDKAKSDPLVKIIAVLQILWSIIQIVTRALRHLPISLLELDVLALAACALFIYGLCWYKPKQVQVATTILTYDEEIPPELKNQLEQVEMGAAWVILFDTAKWLQSWFFRSISPPRGAPLPNTRIQLNHERMEEEKPESLADEESGNCARQGGAVVAAILNDGQPHPEKQDLVKRMVVAIVSTGKRGVAGSLFVAATVFGAVHVLGWNFDFPTRAEKIIWRCASIYILALPLVIVILFYIGRFLLCEILRFDEGRVHFIFSHGGTILSWVYLGARFCILVGTVLNFVSLPPGAFISTWTANIPHFD
ncbi:paternally-expressed gene 3 protein [Naviculisporaceae sp. PSN 640]